MPGNYRARGGGGRYFNNGNYGGPNRAAQPSPVKQEPATVPKAENQPPKNQTTGPAITITDSPPVNAKPQNSSVPSNPTNSEADDAASKVKKFTQRSRLFVGNMPLDVSEEDFKNLFKKYGEISETFVHTSKGFGFVRLDTRANAERAKLELDGYSLKGRPLKIRFASHGAALSLKHLSPFVSNELLESAFQRFGPVERAVVIVDDRGRSTGRGIVEFARKSSATKALSQISEGCFLLTSSPQAIVAKPLDQEDTEDGLSEKNVHKTQQYTQEREAPPRFSSPGTFEHEFAMRWKALDEMERQQQEQLNKEIASARQKLESEMENAIHEHKTMLMKQELMRRQEELTRIEEQRKRDLERRKQLEYEREDQHKKELEALVKRQEILRAQVEGQRNLDFDNFPGHGPRHLHRPPNYPPPSGDPSASSRGLRTGLGGFGGPPPMIHDSALEYMAGGQGGLGPAPSRQARFEPGPGGRPFPPPPFPPVPQSSQGFAQGQRRGYPGSPMDFDSAQKRRRY